MTGYGRLLAIDAGVFDEPDHPDAEFSFVLERLLDGVRVLIDRRATR